MELEVIYRDDAILTTRLKAPMYICDLWGRFLGIENKLVVIPDPTIADLDVLPADIAEQYKRTADLLATLHKATTASGIAPELAMRMMPLSTECELIQTGFQVDIINKLLTISQSELPTGYEFYGTLSEEFANIMGVLL